MTQSTDEKPSCPTVGDGSAILAKQPILTPDLALYGYELLCRAQQKDLNNAQATADVLVNALTEVSLSELVENKFCFINFSPELLDILLPFDSQLLVIEILEHSKVSDELINSLKKLREKKFTIALDDFVLTKDTIRLLPYADIIKLDVLQLSQESLIRHVEKLRTIKGIKLLAEKVETQEMFEFCQTLNFDLYQGYFFAKPKIVEGRRIKEGKQALLRLISLLNDPNADIEEIEQLTASDPVLSFKLLKLINSAGLGVSQKIESLRHAITLLGLGKLRSWVMLLSLANLSDQPQVLNSQSLERAHLCEMIGSKVLGKNQAGACFSVGLFSLIDTYLSISMKEALESMSLPEEMENALLTQEGIMGKCLETTTLYCTVMWDQIDHQWLAEHDLSIQEVCNWYLEATVKARQTLASIEGL